MTYCIGMRLDQGLVLLSDSRTNAGVDQVGTFRKMTVFERPGERVIALMSAGNLAITQAVRQLLVEPPAEGTTSPAPSLWNVPTLHGAADVVGHAVRRIHERDAAHLKAMDIEFNCSLILAGQIGTERPRLFQIYSAGNYIEATDENLYFQIGESKYGKPIIDRVVTPSSTLDEAAKCALVSMDSTLKSNVSVGLPLDLLVYETGALRVTRYVTIDQDNAYFQMVRRTWGQRLKQVFSELPDPAWAEGHGSMPVRAPLPERRHDAAQGLQRADDAAPVQSFADGPVAKEADS